MSLQPKSAAYTEEMHVKMCKKVADLTRVVDKLFRQFYEQNIAMENLQTKHKSLAGINERLEKEKADAMLKLSKCKEENGELKKRNDHLMEEVNSMNKQLGDIEDARDVALKKISSLNESLRASEQQLKELQLMYKQLVESHQQKEVCSGHNELIDSLQEKLLSESLKYDELISEKDLLQLSFSGLQSHYKTAVEQCEQLTKKVEMDGIAMEALQSEKCNLQLKITQLLKELQELRFYSKQQGIKKAVHISRKTEPQRREYWLQGSPKETKDEELEQLKQELQRYRLELMNRESNFNRVFTDHTPVNLKDRRSHISDTNYGSAGIQLHLPRLQPSSSYMNNLKPKR